MQISGRDLSNFCFNVYDSETWTSRRADERLIDSLEIWLWRRMEGIGWRDGVTPEKVLDRVVEQRSLTKKKSGDRRKTGDATYIILTGGITCSGTSWKARWMVNGEDEDKDLEWCQTLYR